MQRGILVIPRPNHICQPAFSRECLPFVVRIARSDDDLRKAVMIRHTAYARHVPTLAEKLIEPEACDYASDAVVLLAESKLDQSPLGTMRISTNRFQKLGLEQSVTLPARFDDAVLSEATRLGIARGRIGMDVKNMLFKAYYLHCLNTSIKWMVIAARSPLDRQYEGLQFSDVFPGGGFIPMAHAGMIPHRVLALKVGDAKLLWEKTQNPLYDMFVRKSHPDIDVGHKGRLPEFLDEQRGKVR